MSHTDDDLYNPYARIGNLWVPESIAMDLVKESLPSGLEGFLPPIQMSRQQRRYQDRQRMKRRPKAGILED